MNTWELTALLAEDAKVLRIRAPTHRVVRSWITNKLIGSSEAKGRGRSRSPIWDMPDESVTRARQILRFIAQGTKRTDGLLVRLWLANFDYPICRIKGALANEVDRLTKRLSPDEYPSWMQSHEPMTPDQIAKRSERLGELDERLTAFRAADETYVQLAAASCVGDEGEFNEGSAVAKDLRRYFPDLDPLFANFAHEWSMAGMLAKPLDQETPSPNRVLIMEAADADMTAARCAYQTVKEFLRDPRLLAGALGHNLSEEQKEAFASAALSLNSLEWEALAFVQVLRLQQADIFANASFDHVDPAITERFESLFQDESFRRMVEPMLALEEPRSTGKRMT